MKSKYNIIEVYKCFLLDRSSFYLFLFFTCLLLVIFAIFHNLPNSFFEHGIFGWHWYTVCYLLIMAFLHSVPPFQTPACLLYYILLNQWFPIWGSWSPQPPETGTSWFALKGSGYSGDGGNNPTSIVPPPRQKAFLRNLGEGMLYQPAGGGAVPTAVLHAAPSCMLHQTACCYDCDNFRFVTANPEVGCDHSNELLGAAGVGTRGRIAAPIPSGWPALPPGALKGPLVAVVMQWCGAVATSSPHPAAAYKDCS